MNINTNINKYKVRQSWRRELVKQNFNMIATIQAPMKHKHSMNKRLDSLANLNRVERMFYSVERNADMSGYHIHLMMKIHKVTNVLVYRETLAWALDVKKGCIPYLSEIDNLKGLSNYVTKYMKGDQIHYNFY